MSELENVIAEPDVTESEIIETKDNESEESVRESFMRTEQLKKEIELENEQQDINFAEIKKTAAPPPQRRRYYYIGTLSASLSLITMGIVMTFSLFSPTGILAAFKFAPLILVFLGCEVGYAMLRNRTARLRYNVKSLILTVSLVAVTFGMSLISITNTTVGGERHYAEERLQNMLAREISAAMPVKNVKSVDIQLHLYGSDPTEYKTVADLEDSDLIDLDITYINAQVSMYEFSQNCRRIMDVLKTMPYNFGKISFIADDDINSYRMEIDWLYQSGFSASELLPLINYFGNEIVMDIPDLKE